MGLDLLLASWLIIAGLLGFRDGSVRKLTSLVMTGVALFVGHMLMRSVGDVFIETLSVGDATGPMMGFLAVFVGIVLVQSIVYKIATESYKIGGLADMVAGSFLGLFQGMLFLSSLLFILSFAGVPSKSTKEYSKIYRSVVNIAPQLLDLFTTVQTSSFEDIEAFAREKGSKSIERIIKPGTAAADSLKKNRLLQEVEKRADKASGTIDSLRSTIRQ